MQLKEIKSKLEKIEFTNMNSSKDLSLSLKNYKELLSLKVEILFINLCTFNNDEIDDYELLKFKILEELIFTEMDIRDIKGITLDETHEKLNTLYKKSIGDRYEE